MIRNPFKNISLNLSAKGPATVLTVWIISILALGLFGKGELAGRALSILTIAGGLILIALVAKIDSK
jgi:hypothetical protein